MNRMKRGQKRGLLLRLLRISQGRTLSQVAIKAQCDMATLSRQERDLLHVPEENDLRVLEALGGETSLVGLIDYLQSWLEWLRIMRLRLA